MRFLGPPLVLTILFIAGICGLVDELGWIRSLTLTFGGTVQAAAAVLSAFMAGLALGSWIGGILADRFRPLLVLGFAQGALGLLSFGLVPFFSVLPGFYAFVIAYFKIGHAAVLPLRMFLSLAVLIIPASLIAMVFPLITKIRSSGRMPGANVGIIYGIDTLGAFLGAGLAGFVFLRLFGNAATLCAAAGGNCVLGALCFLYVKNRPVKAGGLDEKETTAENAVSAARQPPARNLLAAAFALSGAAALSYELLVTKALVHVLQMRIYSVTIMLMCFLGGMGLGSLLCKRFLSSVRSPLWWFAGAQALCALLGLSLPLQFPAVPFIKNSLDRLLLPVQHLGAGWIADALACFGVLFIPALVMGATLPLLVEAVKLRARHIGREVGALYCFNTAGAVFGVLFTTFVILPKVSYTAAFGVAAAMNCIASFLAVISCKEVRGMYRGAFTLTLLVLSTVIAIFSVQSPLERTLLARTPDPKHDQVRFFKEGPSGSVAVVRTADQRVGFSDQMLVNGHLEGGSDIGSLRAFQLLGNLPFFYHAQSRRPLRVLVLAFGMGITLGQVSNHAVDSLTCVELVPEVLAAGPYFADYNESVLSKKNISVNIEDARNFLLATDREFDIIIMDATHPTHGDSWMLYTYECYRDVKRRLAPGGVMAQWIPLHGMTPEAYFSVLHTAQTVFPHLSLWSSPESGHSIIVGAPDSGGIDAGRVMDWAADSSARRGFEAAEIPDAFTFLSYFITGEAALSGLTAKSALNTDDLAPVQFARSFVLTSESAALYRALSDLKLNFGITSNWAAGLDSASGVRLLAANQAAMLDRAGMGFRQMEPFVKDEYRPEMQRKILAVYRQALDTYPEDRDASLFLGLSPKRLRQE